MPVSTWAGSNPGRTPSTRWKLANSNPAPMNPITGETRSASNTDQTCDQSTPWLTLRDEVIALTMDTPSSEPMIACELEQGIPTNHVATFQISAARMARTMAT